MYMYDHYDGEQGHGINISNVLVQRLNILIWYFNYVISTPLYENIGLVGSECWIVFKKYWISYLQNVVSKTLLPITLLTHVLFRIYWATISPKAIYKSAPGRYIAFWSPLSCSVVLVRESSLDWFISSNFLRTLDLWVYQGGQLLCPLPAHSLWTHVWVYFKIFFAKIAIVVVSFLTLNH